MSRLLLRPLNSMKTSLPALVAALAVWLIPLCVALLGADETGEFASYSGELLISSSSSRLFQ